MAEKESGWAGLFPQVDGYYWMRLSPDDTAPTIVRCEARQLHGIGNADDLRWANLLKSAQFLPASPSDAEQLSELRRVAKKALEWFAGFPRHGDASTFDLATAHEVYEQLCAVLNPQPEKETQ